MRMSLNGATLFAGLALAGAAVMADGTRFSDFTPLPASAGPTVDESMPLTFGNPAFEQRSIVDRETQLAFSIPNSGNWDMNTVNETGPHNGRYLFTVLETGQSGMQRHDLLTGVTETIWYSPAASPALQSRVAFDPAYWTPWGTLITGEEKLVHCRRRMHRESFRQVKKRFKPWRRLLGDDVNTRTESGGKPVGRVLTREEQDRLLETAEANAEWEHVCCAAILAANMAMPA